MPADPDDPTALGPPLDPPLDPPGEPDPRWSAELRSLSHGSASEVGREAFAEGTLAHLRRSRDPERYEVEAEVARGGQGTVLRVFDPSLNRRLAMKVMLPGRVFSPKSVNPRDLGRFLGEAQITGQLDHPGIVPVHELGLDEDGRPYFTMKLVQGESLASVFGKVRAGEEGWTRTRALGVLVRVCEAMAYAHSKGVTHRDLKPSNVMVGRFGEVFVMDWGLASVASAPSSLEELVPLEAEPGPEEEALSKATRSTDGRIVGTAWYMSPEQAGGRRDEVGPHCDTYAIGAILYELLTGDPPYFDDYGDRPAATVVHAILTAPPTPVHYLSPNLASELIEVCERAMARRIEDRYPSVMQLAADLQACIEAPKTRNLSRLRKDAVERVRKGHARNAALIVAGVLVALSLVALSLAWKYRAEMRAYHEERRRIETEEDLGVARAELAELSGIRERARDLQGFLDDAFVAEAFESVARERVDAALPAPRRDEVWLERATRSYREALEADVHDEGARLCLGAALADHGDRANAIAVLGAFRGSAGADRLALLGALLRDAGEPLAAAEAYSEALGRDPGRGSLRLELGRASLEAGDPAAAIAAFAVAVAKRPQSFEARRSLGEAYLAAEQWPEAEAVLLQASGLAPRDARVWRGIARARRERGRRAEAMEALLIAAEAGEDELPAAERRAVQQELGLLALETGDHELALVALERSLENASHAGPRALREDLDDLLFGRLSDGAPELRASERLELARTCSEAGLYETATALYRRALGPDGGPAPEPREGHALHAARSAARVAGTRGGGAEILQELAAAWLERELEGWLDAVSAGRVGREEARLALAAWVRDEALRTLGRRGTAVLEEVEAWLAK